MDDLSYLEPNFDPNKCTTPKLRSILVAHDVPYRSTAKNAELVALFNKHVLPKAAEILAARAAIQRSAEGIRDA